MRVLLTNHHPLAGSGAGAYIDQLARALVNAGHEVRCLLVDQDSHSQLAQPDPCPVRRIVCRRDMPRADLDFDLPMLVPRGNGTQSFAQLSDDELLRYRDTLRRGLDREVAEFDPQIIHCQHAWLFAQLALESGVPYVVTAHGEELSVGDDPRFAPLLAEAAENAGCLITATQALMRAFQNRYHDVELRCEVQPPGMDVEASQPPSTERDELLKALGLPLDLGPVVGCVARFAPGQGVTTLLNAAAVYERTDRTLHTVLIGDGPQRQELESQASHQGLAQVHWLGLRSPEDCRRLYALADIMVLPAHRWPSTWVLLESLAAGTPVVAARSGGTDEILTSEFGAIVPAADHEILAETLLSAVEEDWKSTRGPAARQYVATHFPLAGWVEHTVAVYRRVLEARFGNHPPG